MAPPDEAPAVRGLDPRMSPKQVGAVLALTSEVMLFSGLFASWFFLKAETPQWPPAGIDPSPVVPAVACAVVVGAAVAAVSATRQLEAGDRRGGGMRLVLVAVAGSVFAALTLLDWATQDFAVGENAYTSLYYWFGGLHLLHVVAGLIALAALWQSLRTSRHPDPADARITAYLWYAIAGLWLAIFGVVFLIG